MRRALLTATILALVMVGPARAECMRAEEPDNIAEGRLMARGDAMILELPQPMCLAGAGETDNVEDSAEIHVYADDAGVEETLRSLVGKDVHLRGSLMGAVTQHHKAPIVMRVREADEI
jgi:hypothetical protein